MMCISTFWARISLNTNFPSLIPTLEYLSGPTIRI